MTITIEALTVRHGSVEALSGVDLSVREGERVALVGPSGAGKSTLLAVIAGIVAPTSGSLTVLGRDLSTLRGRELRRHRSAIGYLGQDPALPGSLRVIHNVNSGRLGSWSTLRSLSSLVVPSEREVVDEVLERVGLTGFSAARTGALSGGEQQRVGVARVLRHSPDLVLADEPVSAVDPRLSEVVLGELADRSVPWTIVMSLHEPGLARRFADRVVGLKAGKVLFDRSPEEVSDAELEALYRTARS